MKKAFLYRAQYPKSLFISLVGLGHTSIKDEKLGVNPKKLQDVMPYDELIGGLFLPILRESYESQKIIIREVQPSFEVYDKPDTSVELSKNLHSNEYQKFKIFSNLMDYCVFKKPKNVGTEDEKGNALFALYTYQSSRCAPWKAEGRGA